MSRRKEFVAGIFLLAMAVSHLVMAAKLTPYLRNGYPNFASFYTAGTMVRTGQATALYDLPAQYEMQKQFAPNVSIRQAALPYIHPPFEALLFAPLTLLPYWPSYLLWTALNLVLLAVSLLILRSGPGLKGVSPIFLALAAAGFYPAVTSLIQGQDCILLLFLFVLAVVALEKRWDTAAGLLLAGGMFRFQLVLPVILLLAIRRWRILLGFVPMSVLLGVLSLGMVGWTGVTGYLHFLINMEKGGAGGSIVPSGMPNLRGLLAGLPGVSADSSPIFVATMLCSVAVMGIAGYCIRFQKYSLRFTFTLATVAALLVSYHSLTYDLSLLFPAILLLFADGEHATKRSGQIDILLLLLLYALPRFELVGAWLSPFVWFAAFLFWLFRKGNLSGQLTEHATGTQAL
ncbi:MAG: DUF2029 domain-containing protein [Acidobacteria bacterium]|nr:DUF2029 domain-containing protein [Acidobacteriota bacterium]